jgi:hypothetical protein
MTDARSYETLTEYHLESYVVCDPDHTFGDSDLRACVEADICRPCAAMATP